MAKRTAWIAAAALLALTGAAEARARQWIFAPDGTLQCGMGEEITLERAKAALEQRGVQVVAAEKRRLPMATVAQCGAPTGKVNAFEITDEDWAKLRRAAPAAFLRWVFDKPTIAVFKYDGTLQCGLGKEVTLAQMAASLEAAGIKVLGSRKANDGKLHVQLCGASSGRVNVFEIPTASLAAAQQLGFDLFIAENVLRDMLGEEPKFRAQTTTGGAESGVVPLPW